MFPLPPSGVSFVPHRSPSSRRRSGHACVGAGVDLLMPASTPASTTIGMPTRMLAVATTLPEVAVTPSAKSPGMFPAVKSPPAVIDPAFAFDVQVMAARHRVAERVLARAA